MKYNLLITLLVIAIVGCTVPSKHTVQNQDGTISTVETSEPRLDVKYLGTLTNNTARVVDVYLDKTNKNICYVYVPESISCVNISGNTTKTNVE